MEGLCFYEASGLGQLCFTRFEPGFGSWLRSSKSLFFRAFSATLLQISRSGVPKSDPSALNHSNLTVVPRRIRELALGEEASSRRSSKESPNERIF